MDTCICRSFSLTCKGAPDSQRQDAQQRSKSRVGVLRKDGSVRAAGGEGRESAGAGKSEHS